MIQLRKYYDNSKKYILSGLIAAAMITGANLSVGADYYTAKLFAVEASLFFMAASYSTYMADFLVQKPYIKEDEEEVEEDQEDE